MSKRDVTGLAGAVRRVRKDAFATLSDRELLRRYAESADQAAFETLAGRHTGLVLGVCKRTLGTEQDAEDACQAVFLVLARKARANRWQSSVANWLYTTARKVARNARVAAARRVRREGAAAIPESVPPADALSGRELVELLEEELEKLPPHYREPLVLCYLEGLTRDEAAVRLGVPASALKGHLERGRKRLADALTARGFPVGVALLATAATSEVGASPPVLRSILAAAEGSPSPAAAALAREVAVNGIYAYAKVTLLGLVGAVALALGLTSVPSAAEPKKSEPASVPVRIDPAKKLTIRVLSPAGKPVPNSTVICRSRGRFDESAGETNLGRTNAAGRLEVEARPGSLYLALAEGYATAFSGPDVRGPALDLKLGRPMAIQGRLVDLQGRPIPDAKVEVVSVSGCANDDLTPAYNAFRVNPEWSRAAFSRVLDGRAAGAPPGTRTGKDGRFELKGVGADHVVRLRFRATGIEVSSVNVFADPDFARKVRPATDSEKRGGFTREHTPAVYGPGFTHPARPEHLIVGSVVDSETGKPVPGVEIWGTTVPVTTSLLMLTQWGDHVVATTDDRGKFTLTGLAKAVVYNLPFLPREARRYLHVRAVGKPYLDRVVSVPDAADYTPVRVEVKLRPALVVRGTILDKVTRKPVRGEVHWLPLTSNVALAESKDEDAALYTNRLSSTRPTGVWRETGSDGEFRLQVPPGPCVLLARAADDPEAVYTSVQVRDQDRRHLQKPTPREGVILVGPRERAGEQMFDTIRLVWPLRWENGYAVLEPDAKTRTVDVKIEFDPGATVKLGVSAPDGTPLTGVTMVGHGKYGRPPRVFDSPEIAVGGLNPQRQAEQLYLLHRQKRLCGEIAVKGDEKGLVAVQMRPCATVTGRVVDAAGKPVAGMQVSFQMTDAVADDLVRQKLFRDENATTTGADGRFCFERMFPGVEFDLGVFRPGFRSGEAASSRMTLKPGEIRDVGNLEIRAPKKASEK